MGLPAGQSVLSLCEVRGAAGCPSCCSAWPPWMATGPQLPGPQLSPSLERPRSHFHLAPERCHRWFSTFNWGHKGTPPSTRGSTNRWGTHARRAGRGRGRGKAVEEMVGPQVRQARPEPSPAARAGRSAPPSAASYLERAAGPHTLPSTAGQSLGSTRQGRGRDQRLQQKLVSSSRPGLGWQCGLRRAPLGWVTQGRRVTGVPKQPACLSRHPGLSSQRGRLGWGRQARPGSQRGTDLLAQFTCCLPTPQTWPSLEERRGNTPPRAALTPREGRPSQGGSSGRAQVPACSQGKQHVLVLLLGLLSRGGAGAGPWGALS